MLLLLVNVHPHYNVIIIHVTGDAFMLVFGICYYIKLEFRTKSSIKFFLNIESINKELKKIKQKIQI